MNTIDKYTDEVVFNKIIDRTIDEFVDDVITAIGGHTFKECTALTIVECPEVTDIGRYAFQNCSALTTANFPKLSTMTNGSSIFEGCTNLMTVNFPELTKVPQSMFYGCTALQRIELPEVIEIGSNAFKNCTSLTTVILSNTEQVATLKKTNAFDGSSNARIYVPDNLVESYKTATNWSTWAGRIKGLSELPS